MEVIWSAIIIAISSTVSPLVLSYFVNRAARKARLEDWARQDAVAARAAEAAHLLIASNKKIAETAADVAAESVAAHNLLIESNEKIAKQTAKLDDIHTIITLPSPAPGK
jgi:hypothetical protein